MAQSKRIYSITSIDDGKILALAHYTRRTLGCEVAIPERLIEATKGGIEVEKAGEENGE